MKIINLELNTGKATYSEGNQSSGIKFNVVRRDTEKNYYQEYKSFKCKDFYNELILGRFLKYTPEAVHRFEQKSIWNDRSLMISIESLSQKEIDGVIKNIGIINSLELELMNIPKKRISKIFLTNCKNVLVIKFPKEWIRSNPLFSLYTLLIRSLGYFGDYKLSSFEELIIKIIALQTSDSYLFNRIFVLSSFSIYKFLKNHKEIFTKNPITGLNDRKLKKELIFKPTSPNIGIYWDGYKQHDFGILNFAIRLKNNCNENYLGKDHVIKYLELE